MPDLASMTHREAAEWIISEAEITVGGWGRNFIAALSMLRDADVAAAEERVREIARQRFLELRQELEDGIRTTIYTECADLVDDAVLAGDPDPKSKIIQVRDNPPA